MVLTKQEIEDAKKAIQFAGQYEERKQQAIEKRLAEERSKILRINPSKLIAIHMTDYFPERGVIKTLGNAVEFYPKLFKNMSINYDYTLQRIFVPRQTIHFSLNGAVESHGYGNWDNKKYAILIPLYMIFGRVYCLNPVDTYVIGDLELPKGSEILGKVQDLDEKNPGKAKMIFINEEKGLTSETERIIEEMGYALASVGQWAHNWNLFLLPQTDAKALLIDLFGEGINELIKKPYLWGLFGDSFYEFPEVDTGQGKRIVLTPPIVEIFMKLGINWDAHWGSDLQQAEDYFTSAVTLIWNTKKYFSQTEEYTKQDLIDAVYRRIRHGDNLIKTIAKIQNRHINNVMHIPEQEGLAKIISSLRRIVSELIDFRKRIISGR